MIPALCHSVKTASIRPTALFRQNPIRFQAPICTGLNPGMSNRVVIHLNLRHFGNSSKRADVILPNFHLSQDADENKSKFLESFKKGEYQSIEMERGSVINSEELISELLTDVRSKGNKTVEIVAHSVNPTNGSRKKSVSPSLEEMDQHTKLLRTAEIRPKKLVIQTRLSTQKIERIAKMMALSSHATSFVLSFRKFSTANNQSLCKEPFTLKSFCWESEKKKTRAQISSYLKYADYPTIRFDGFFANHNWSFVLDLFREIDQMEPSEIVFTVESEPNLHNGKVIDLFHPNETQIDQVALLFKPEHELGELAFKICLNLKTEGVMHALQRFMSYASRNLNFTIEVIKKSSD